LTAVTAQTKPVIVVSGLPRSGTSLMMQMLAAGGLPVLTDEVREADDSNPRGYYEFDAVKGMAGDRSWLTQADGGAVKVVAQLLPNLPTGRRFRVLFMERPLGEVVASQRAMLQRLGKEGAHTTDARLARAYLNQVAQVKKLLQHYSGNIECLSVPYHQALEEPARTAAQVNAFLGGGLDPEAMAAAIEPTLRNQREGDATG